ncbi:ParB/RepB/Spo0J family partition protein [Microbaculum marinum]|uniref:ParB/RepB/Spo0J family partition protein n=1 Tax=Microbaculum marinum TaxID=1764581 RepID=A0AAW9S190_9HYPH
MSVLKKTDEPQQGREAPPSRLGRGLAALIGDVDTEKQAIERARSQRRLPIEFLRANPRNPRKSFADEDLGDLAASIREKGIMQPILVRPTPEDATRFEIIAGERRWRAAQRAGLHEVPVVVLAVDDREALEIAIIENVQRSDLNPLEEAEGYQRLIEEFSYSQAQLADVIGKSRSHVANTIRLLKLPETVRAYVTDGKLSAGHARTLVTHEDPERAARAIIETGLNVREAEALTRKADAPGRNRTAPKPAPDKDADTRALEKQLADTLGLSVDIRHKADGTGEIRVRYKTLEQLEAVTGRLAR